MFACIDSRRFDCISIYLPGRELRDITVSKLSARAPISKLFDGAAFAGVGSVCPKQGTLVCLYSAEGA